MNDELSPALKKRLDDFLDGGGDASDLRRIFAGLSEQEQRAAIIYVKDKSAEAVERNRARISKA